MKSLALILALGLADAAFHATCAQDAPKARTAPGQAPAKVPVEKTVPAAIPSPAKPTEKPAEPAATGSARPATPAAPAPSPARHFHLTIVQGTRAGALAEGGYFDLAPGATLPKSSGLLGGTPLEKTWTPLGGDVFVRDLAAADNNLWEGMLERDGVYTFVTVSGRERTVNAYKFSFAPDPTGRPAAHTFGEKPRRPHSPHRLIGGGG